VARLDTPVTVLSILPVQSELGALEVAAQADLVRVLTHEIMRLALANAEDRDIKGRVEVTPGSFSLQADPELLAQALLNLLRNSIRATSEIACPVVVLSLAREPTGQCRIEVRDNGGGIPEDRRDDIFLPFYTTHKGGSGVGLSFSKQVALAHGGSICALAAPEGGANIRMVI
jgi:signal transduction histidine kinase